MSLVVVERPSATVVSPIIILIFVAVPEIVFVALTYVQSVSLAVIAVPLASAPSLMYMFGA